MDFPELLVLAGGFGTRLKSILPGLPKPLAPVGAKTFLFYYINNWKRQGIKKFTFLLHYNAETIREYLLNTENSKFFQDLQFNFIIEKYPLGTGGAVKNAILKNKMTEPFLLSNADTWIGDCVKSLVNKSEPSIGLIKIDNTLRYGSVEIKGNKVISFIEKQKSETLKHINAGVYYLSPTHFNIFQSEVMSLEKDFLPKLASKGILSPAYLDTTFIDIGIPEDYLRFINWKNSDIDKL